MNVTLKDVAREADCSLMAVSRVMGGRQLNHVGPVLQQRIREAAIKLNYQSNPVARALRTGRSHSIGLVVGKISGRTQACYAHALHNEVRKYGYRLDIALTNYVPMEEEKALEELLNRQNDGIIYTLTLNPDSDICRQLIARKTPVLFTSQESRQFNTVSMQSEEAFINILQLFRSRGHSRVGIITGEDNWRGHNYSAIAKQCAVELVPFLHVPLRNSIRKSIEDFVGSEISAVVSPASGIIQSLLQYLRENGIKSCPEYVYPYALPFDYIEENSACLGAVIEPFREIVEAEVAQLIRQIDESDSQTHTALSSIRNLKLSCRFVSPEEVRSIYREQGNDLYYDIL